MLAAMKVAVRDRRELRSRNPLEEVVAVAKLETVDDASRPIPTESGHMRAPVRLRKLRRIETPLRSRSPAKRIGSPCRAQSSTSFTTAQLA